MKIEGTHIKSSTNHRSIVTLAVESYIDMREFLYYISGNIVDRVRNFVFKVISEIHIGPF